LKQLLITPRNRQLFSELLRSTNNKQQTNEQVMKVLKTIIPICLLLTMISAESFGQPAERRISRTEYVDTWNSEAVRQMLAHGVPASITLAQGILESADGNSSLAKYANNHFGIKCHGWQGGSFIIDDDHPNECFRKYENAGESYKDHSMFLKTRGRYDFLFDLKTTDYRGWAKGLRKAGYATNPKYADLLIQIIEDHNLTRFDQMRKVPHLTPKPQEVDIIKLKYVEHKIKVHHNNIKFVIVKEGDSFYKIAKEFELGLWQLYKYNDLGKKDVLAIGDVVYLQPKRNKAKAAHHTVKEGETMRSISQKHGIKLKNLYKKNDMKRGAKPEVGQKLYLKKSIKN
jgi:uncharacterized FlgJ-related protein/LysM repeat protein